MDTNYDVQILIEAQDRASKQLDSISGQLTNLGRQAQKGTAQVTNGLNSISSTLGGLGIVAAFQGIATSAINSAATFEKFSIVLENALGSAEEAAQSLNMIKEVASKTPFEVDKLTASYIKLVNRGFKPTRQQIIQLGDLASTLGKDFDQLVEAMLDAQTGEFERLKEFGVRASAQGNKVAFTFKGVTTTVDKTDEAIKNYILSLGQLEGVTGSMEKISKSFGGSMSNLKDSMTNLGATIGATVLPMLTNLINYVVPVVNSISQRAQQNPELATTITVIVTSLVGLIGALTVLGPVITAVGSALAILTGPIGLIIAGVIALGAAYATNFMGIRDITNEVIGYITTYITEMVTFITTTWNEMLVSLGLTNQDVWNGIKSTIETIRSGIQLYLGSTFELIKGIFMGVFGGIKTFVTQTFGGIKDVIVGVTEIIKGIVNGNFTQMVDGIKQSFGGVFAIITAPFAAAETFVINVINGMIKGINELIDSINSIGDMIGVQIPKLNEFKAKTEQTVANSGVEVAGARAKGGPVSGGSPYLVGEKGPEIFMPKKSGTIVPNNKIGGVSLTIGSINVSNEADENRLVNKIRNMLTRDVELANNFSIS